MRKTLIVPLIAAVLTVAVMVYQGFDSEPVLCEAPAVRLAELDGYVFHDGAPSEAENTVLPKDTQLIKRRYVARNGHWYQIAVVIGGKSKSSIHRPEMCLPGQGFQMMNPHDFEVDGATWHCVTLAHRDAAPVKFAYTFFNQAGFRTASHVSRIMRDVWDRSILGRIDRWVMVTVVSSDNDEQRLTRFLSSAIDH